jgi:hypothetical protein
LSIQNISDQFGLAATSLTSTGFSSSSNSAFFEVQKILFM